MTAETTHRVEQDLGPPIQADANGVPRLVWLSASVLTRADVRQPGGCLRRVWYDYVGGRRVAAPSKAQSVGLQIHAELEDWYLGRGDRRSTLALAMARELPEPGPGLLVEHPIGGSVGGRPDRLTCAGVPVHGHADLVSLRRTSDPAGTVAVYDYKTTSSIEKWAKRGFELATTPQMVTYGWAEAREFGAEWVRLTHVYGQTRGRPEAEARTILVRAQDLERRWNDLHEVGRSVVDAATAPTADEVEPNLSACAAFGGCPHRSYCRAGAQPTLSDVFGPRMAAVLCGQPQEDPVSLLASLKKSALPAVPEGFAEAVAAVEKSGKGFPELFGDAAKAWCAAKKIDPGEWFAGSGFLAGLRISTPADMLTLANELAALTPAVESMPDLLPPDAAEPQRSVEDAPVKKPRATRAKKADAPPATTPAGIHLFVHAVPSTEFERFEPYADALVAELAATFGVPDVRAAADQSPLAYGKWKGALAALAREKPPAPGVYVLLSHDEVDEVIIEAIRSLCTLFVRGVL